MLIIFIRACYSGYERGLVAEVLHLAGLVLITGLTMNYAGAAVGWMHAMVPWQPAVLPAVIFWGLFLTLLGVKQLLVKSLTGVMKWERLHWTIQGLGTVLGGFRGIWWAGLLLLALAHSGVAYLQQSAEERAVLGSRLMPLMRQAMTSAAGALPGADLRGGAALIPALITAPPAPPKRP